MKTAIFTLAALFGLGLGLAVVGVDFGLKLLGYLLAALGLVTLVWGLGDWLYRHLAFTSRPLAPTSARTARKGLPRQSLARLLTWSRSLAAKAPRLPLSPLLSVLLGLSLGAALARDGTHMPAAMLCGALAGALHLLATRPAPQRHPAAPSSTTMPRIADDTQAYLTRLIAALAPCRDPHLHVAARALRRTAIALATQVDQEPTTLSEAHRALSLWLPALAEAAETLREDHIRRPDAAQTTALTATLVRINTHLTAFMPQAGPDTTPVGLATAAA